ncbi:MAG TPA: serine hydrolase domain-containing protein [Gaiellaceae bacterium]|nr:serine hydrolase domain-containing protein [Gaiellaceae bacterium]
MRVAAILALAALAAGCGGAAATPERPALQRTLDALVTGPDQIAPGATAYVAGPQGVWTGASGWADLAKQVRMTPDARMRLESVSKLWTATVVAKLAEEGRLRLDDTVERWLPGRFPYGDRITVRQLLNHTSGMIDNNDLGNRPAYWLGQIQDAALRAEAVREATALQADPTHIFPRLLEIRIAAALPLLSEPGTTWHYSNIGYMTAGLIAEKAGKAPLADLYDRIIVRPLELTSAGYYPAGPIAGRHPVGYSVHRGGVAIPATDHLGGTLQAEGGIVTDAKDEGRFLLGLVTGKIVSPATLAELVGTTPASGSYGLGTVVEPTCAGTAYTHNGGGASWASSVAVSADGKRVAVVLLNGQRSYDPVSTPYYRALLTLFCAA